MHPGKEGGEQLTTHPGKEGGWALSYVFPHLTTKECPYMLTATHCPQIHQSIGRTIMYNEATSLGSSNPDSMQHSKWQHTIVSVIHAASECASPYWLLFNNTTFAGYLRPYFSVLCSLSWFIAVVGHEDTSKIKEFTLYISSTHLLVPWPHPDHTPCIGGGMFYQVSLSTLGSSRWKS